MLITVKAGDLRGGDVFRKKTGTFGYIVISESSARFLGLDTEKVHGISSNGNTTSVSRDTDVVRASIAELDGPLESTTDGSDDLTAAANAIQLETRRFRLKIDDLEAAIYANEEKLTNIAAMALRELGVDFEAEALVLGSWQCPDPERPRPADKPNPLGVCVYDESEDPLHDFCLFCGSPDERK